MSQIQITVTNISNLTELQNIMLYPCGILGLAEREPSQMLTFRLNSPILNCHLANWVKLILTAYTGGLQNEKLQ